MRIEKISDTQIKFILTREDFKQWDLSIAELTYSSDKAKKLFKEMMDRAYIETGFEAEQSPLIIEAVPLAIDSVMIIVSKADGQKTEDFTSPLSSLFNRLSRSDMPDFLEEIKTEKQRSYQAGAEKKRMRVPRNIAIYSFNSIDDVSDASVRLNTFFKGASSLYKYCDKYYICLQLPYKTAVLKMGELETILGEYGQKHVSNTVSRGFLLEHGETLINSNAVNKLASL